MALSELVDGLMYADDSIPSDQKSGSANSQARQRFMSLVKSQFDRSQTVDALNRTNMSEDLNFIAGDQWDADVAYRRTQRKRPVLTINRLPAFVGQVVNARRESEVQARVIPEISTEQAKQEAKVREGMLRFIQHSSNAPRHYVQGLEHAAICGEGYWYVLPDYESDDVFEQKLSVFGVANPLYVLMDPAATDLTGKDARFCFVLNPVDKADFKARYKNKNPVSFELRDGADNYNLYNGSMNQSPVVYTALYFRLVEKSATIARLQSGEVIDTTDYTPEQSEQIMPSIARRPDGSLMVRDVKRPAVEVYHMTPEDILEGPVELPLSRIPVFRSCGWQVPTLSTTRRFGLVSLMKDSQRMHNLWRSRIAEQLSKHPSPKVMAGAAAVRGYENQWRNSHLSDDNLLLYNEDSAGKPEPVRPAEVEGALLQEAQMAIQDMRDVSNIHEANLGAQSNERSSVALSMRRQIGERATALYFHNNDLAIIETGEVLSELLPYVYDTPRMVQIMGEDGEQMMQALNGLDAKSVDITSGRFSTRVTVGQSKMSQRQEAHESMLNMVNAMPDMMNSVADLIVESQDWPGAERIAKRLRKAIPPELLDPSELSDDEREQYDAEKAQREEAMQVQQQQMMEAQMREMQARTELMAAQIKELLARAERAEAAAARDIVRAQTERTETETDRMEAETNRMEAEIERKRVEEEAALRRRGIMTPGETL